MINKETIKAKLNILRENIERAKEILKMSDQELRENNMVLSALERYFQLLVDTAVGINEHIISEESLEIPNDYFRTFSILGNNNVLPMEFAERIAPSVGLRNQLVHQYEKIDSERMIKDMKKNITQYDQYMMYIVKYCNLE